MHHRVQAIKKFLKRPAGIITVIVLVILIFFVTTRNGAQGPDLYTVSRGTIQQVVSATGSTAPVDAVNLSFEKNGRVASLSAKVGDEVKAGQTLITLDTSALSASLLDAKANLAAEKAKLAELARGTRPEELIIKQAEVKKTEQTLLDYYNDIPNTLENAYAQADDAVRTKTAPLFSGSKSTGYSLTFVACDTTSQLGATNGRLSSEFELEKWNNEITPISTATPQKELESFLSAGSKHLNVAQNFLKYTSDVLSLGCPPNNSTFDGYRTNVSTARTNIINETDNINDLLQLIDSQTIALEKAQAELNLALAGSTSEEIAAQEARVAQAEAKVKNAEVDLVKATLRAPIAGTVTKVEARIGETATANTTIITVISVNKLEIEAHIAEADIAKLKVGNTVSITLDAYGDEVVFPGHVAFIDPAETVIEGVPTYATTFNFDQADARVKPGLTANLEILTDERGGTLIIPQRALLYRDDKKFVLLYRADGEPEEREVTTGLRGSDGTIEILSGLIENDQILRSPK